MTDQKGSMKWENLGYKRVDNLSLLVQTESPVIFPIFTILHSMDHVLPTFLSRIV